MKNNKPIKKARIGHFEISLWKNRRVIKAKNDFDAERKVETVRACIQHSRYKNTEGAWQNQNIWCNTDELRDLAQLLDQFNEEDEESPDNESGNPEAPK
jgi:hypothetical protein